MIAWKEDVLLYYQILLVSCKNVGQIVTVAKYLTYWRGKMSMTENVKIWQEIKVIGLGGKYALG